MQCKITFFARFCTLKVFESIDSVFVLVCINTFPDQEKHEMVHLSLFLFQSFYTISISIGMLLIRSDSVTVYYAALCSVMMVMMSF